MRVKRLVSAQRSFVNKREMELASLQVGYQGTSDSLALGCNAFGGQHNDSVIMKSVGS